MVQFVVARHSRTPHTPVDNITMVSWDDAARHKMKQCDEILIQWMRDTNDIYLNRAENFLVDGVVPY